MGCPGFPGVRPLDYQATTILLWFSNSSGEIQPRALCRRRRLCQILRHSKIALASNGFGPHKCQGRARQPPWAVNLVDTLPISPVVARIRTIRLIYDVPALVPRSDADSLTISQVFL